MRFIDEKRNASDDETPAPILKSEGVAGTCRAVAGCEGNLAYAATAELLAKRVLRIAQAQYAASRAFFQRTKSHYTATLLAL